MTSQQLVDGYLVRLERAAAVLLAARRVELVAEVREHIEAALETTGDGDEMAVRNVLERLGSPEEIVAAELDGARGQEPAAGPGAAAMPAARTEFRIVVIVIVGVLVVLLALMAAVFGPARAIVALATAVLTPYVWISLLVAGAALVVTRGSAEGTSVPRRGRPAMIGLAAISALLLVAFVAQGAFFMGTVALLVSPIIVLMLVLEVLRGRRTS